MLFPVQIAILITDGKSQDSVQEPAQKLRGQGVVVFAVGKHLPPPPPPPPTKRVWSLNKILTLFHSFR